MKVTPGRLIAAGLVVLVAFFVLWVAPSNDYIFLPDRAHPVAPLVFVQGGHNPKRGGVYFVDVIVRKATLLERLFGGLHKGAQLYPADEINPPGVDDSQRRRIDLQDMQLSQQTAAAVALKALGKPVRIVATGALVEEVEPNTPAVGKLEPDDVITQVDGTHVSNFTQVSRLIRKHPIGGTVHFTVRRATQTLTLAIRTIASDDAGPHRPIVGVDLTTATDIHLPIHVRIDAGNIGGPSAGLAFALEVMEKLGKDVVHGHRIAATGEIFPDGSVGPIGGIEQKVIGAREAGVDAFLVPAGDNATEAKKDAHGLRIIPVGNFQQALRALATLPSKP